MKSLQSKPAFVDGHRGFTLAEVLIGLALAGVAATVIFSVFLSTQGMYYDTRERTGVQSDTRITLGMFSQEIRSAGSDINDIGVERLVVCAGDTVRVQSDLDLDGTIEGATEPSEDITWYYDAANETLIRETASGSMTVMEGVTFFGLNFLDANGAEIQPLPLSSADRRRVRAVEVFMTVRLEEEATRDWSTTIALRNDAVLN